MRFNAEERLINTEGHDLIAKGRAKVLEAERMRKRRKASYEQAIADGKRRQEERIARLRKECIDSGDNLIQDLLKSQVGYPGIVLESVTSNYMVSGSIGDAGEIVIKFHRNP